MRYGIVLCCFLLLPGVPLGAQQVNVTPGDNLVIDGIPPIPAAIAEGVGRYTEFRSAGFVSWHPLKREMLITTRFGDAPQLHLVSKPGGARTQLTFFPERVTDGSFQPTQGDYFIFSKDVGGGEWFQIYRYDLPEGTITLLTDGKSRNSLGPWSTKGDRIAYTSTRRNRKDTDIYIVQPKNPASDHLLAQLEGGGWGPLDWSPDDQSLLVGEYVSVNESSLWLMDVSTGEKKLLTPKGNEQIAYGAARFSKNGKGIYYTSDQGSEFQRLMYRDLKTNQERMLTPGISWDVESFDLSPDGNSIAFVTNEAGVSVLHLIDARSGKEQRLPKLPTAVIGSVTWHPAGRVLAFTMNSAKTPSDVYTLDIVSGNVERWTFSETGGISTAKFSEAELVHWPTFDGKSISGFKYAPPKSFNGKRPVIVNIHGGPEGQSRPGFLGRGNYYLNEMGVVIIYPNIRGSTGYGKTFAKLDNGMKRADSYKDLAALLDWIKLQPDLDGNRIMVTGGSYGGHSTLAVATHYNDKIRCSVDIVGMSNLVTFLERTEAYRRDLRRAEYGNERDSTMRSYLQSIAPMNLVGNVTKPMFIIQGKNDPRVPASEADQMTRALKENKTPVWYLMANDEGHGFGKKKNADFQMYATVAFMNEFLLK